MNRNILKNTGFIAILLFLGACASRKTTSAQTVSDAEINKWYDKNEWAGGLQIKAYAEINKREFYEQYHKHPEWWDKTFAYMKNNDLAKLPNGKVPIVGDSVFVTVTEAPDKDFDKTMWESHRNFIDLQYVAAGKEQILMNNPDKLTVTVPYNPTKDAANYTGEPFKTYIAVPGTFYLFFPSNAHRPSIKVDANVVKKVTFKIRYSK